MIHHRLIWVLTIGLFCVAGQQALAAAPVCEQTIELAPNEKRTIATSVQNDGSFYTSQVLTVKGRVRTDDGKNTLASAWLITKDVFRWGTTTDVKNLGGLFGYVERLSFWGKGMVELRVQALASPTHLCLCTRDEDRPFDAGYLKRVDTCMSAIRST